MKGKIHGAAGALAMVTILVFLTSTIAVELSGGAERIAAVKRFIAWGLLLLVPALAATGISGNILARGKSDPLLRKKQLRMPFIAGNGLLVLVPAALYLHHLAAQGTFGTTFFVVQTIELVAGATNLILIGLNARDGFRLARVGAAEGPPRSDELARS